MLTERELYSGTIAEELSTPHKKRFITPLDEQRQACVFNAKRERISPSFGVDPPRFPKRGNVYCHRFRRRRQQSDADDSLGLLIESHV